MSQSQPYGHDESQPTVLISMLQHYLYCPRQFGLIHLEQTFTENVLTLDGNRAHTVVDEPHSVTQNGVPCETALAVWSHRLRMRGKADLVEFHESGPCPVEYKHGRKSRRLADEVQLCAQALCLEEMFDARVGEGALFHFSSRARRTVTFDRDLRDTTKSTIRTVRKLLCSAKLPAPVADGRCRNCSLRGCCVPEIKSESGRIKRYLSDLYALLEPREDTG